MYEYRCEVERVIDGDTVDLIVDLGFHLKIRERFRLFGIDAPEVRGPEKQEGKLATTFLIKLLGEAEGIIVRTEKQGSFRRWLGDILVYKGGKEISVSHEMIKKGHAEPYKKG